MITSFSGEYDFLSNFHASSFSEPLDIPGVIENFQTDWRTVEHFFQAHKATTKEDAWFIQDAATPGQAKRRGRSVLLNPRWETYKISVMIRGVYAKFRDNPELATRLAATFPQPLIECNAWGDQYWGAVTVQHHSNYEWVGYNYLGKILDLVREEMRHTV